MGVRVRRWLAAAGGSFVALAASGFGVQVAGVPVWVPGCLVLVPVACLVGCLRAYVAWLASSGGAAASALAAQSAQGISGSGCDYA